MSWRSALSKEIRDNYAVSQQFTLTDLYRRSEARLQQEFPRNSTVQATMRQVLQRLRDDGIISFVDDKGTYMRLR